jgi:hypothetical protein
MKTHLAKALLHIASPLAGNEVRKLVRDLARFAGVARVLASTKVPRLLAINYDPNVIQVHTLVSYVRRDWTGTRLV